MSEKRISGGIDSPLMYGIQEWHKSESLRRTRKRIDKLNDAWNGVNRAINVLDEYGDSSELTDILHHVRSNLDERIDRLCQRSASTVGRE